MPECTSRTADARDLLEALGDLDGRPVVVCEQDTRRCATSSPPPAAVRTREHRASPGSGRL